GWRLCYRGRPTGRRRRSVCPMVNLTQNRRQVLEPDLNRSESRRGTAEPLLCCHPNDSTPDAPGGRSTAGFSVALCPLMGGTGRRQEGKLERGAKDEEHAMPHKLNSAIAVIGIDIGKNSFHVVGHDKRGAIMLRQKWSRGQVEARLANLPPCLIGMEACVGA